MASYPKWLYHPTKAPALVANEDEHKALGPEWLESPAYLKAKADAPKAFTPEKADPKKEK